MWTSIAVTDQFRFSAHIQYEEARDTIEDHEGIARRIFKEKDSPVF